MTGRRDEPTTKDGEASSAPAWHAQAPDTVLEALDVDPKQGLSEHEIRERRARHGPNRLRESETRPLWRILVEQFRSIVVYLLGAAAILAFATARWPEAIAVTAVILVNTGIGFVSEWRAMRSMAALRKLGEHDTRVRREGQEAGIPASAVVPGDVVLLEAGDLVPADLRLLAANHLRVNEAALTGESVPADKTIDPVDEDTPLADRTDMLYRGTTIADGTAEAVVVATGMATELGHIAALAESAEAAVTPLRKRLDGLGRRLAWLTVGIAAFLVVLGLLVRDQEVTLVIETALALGIAAIPEGLPILATIALAHGMYRMARRNALVNRLTAVETLGATRVIFSDKTGTLTENRMELRAVVTADGRLTMDDEHDPLARRVIEVGVLCNTADLGSSESDDEARGDPTEQALLSGGRRAGVERAELLETAPRVRLEEFDPRLKKMASVHARDGGFRVAVKGAPEAVLEDCDRIATGDGEERSMSEEDRERWSREADDLAAEGLRVLAMAEKTAGEEGADPYGQLCFLGLVGLLDPPREGVKSVIDRCQAAGIRVEMVTGDQPKTAAAIAHAVGIVGDADDPEAVVMHGRELTDPDELDDAARDRIHRANIFARVSPEQKLNLVRTYQDHGEIVAMTGDGVNDAPALKKADIGVAMGKRGTESARQVADMILRDDAFETIVAAVEQGRVIFANIRKSTMFMLCTNVAEVLAVAVATLVGWTLPLLPLQILYLNVLTDVFPALALGVGPGSGEEMSDRPRDPREPVLTRGHWFRIGRWSALLAASVLSSLLLAQHWLGLDELASVTVSFLSLAFGKLWLTFALRDDRSAFLSNEITRNRWVWAAVAVCAALLLVAVYQPTLAGLLRTRPPDLHAWLLVLVASLTPLILLEIARLVRRRVRGA